jgi:hypothetical protein
MVLARPAAGWNNDSCLFQLAKLCTWLSQQQLHGYGSAAAINMPQLHLHSSCSYLVNN